MKYRGFAIALLMVLLVVAGCSQQTDKTAQNNETASSTQAGSSMTAAGNEDAKATKAAGLLPLDQAPMAPEWTLPQVDGSNLTLSEHRGKVIILDFWDTWCPPCKREIPGFIELQKQYGDEGLVVIGAAFGRDGQGAVNQFVKEWGINYPIVLANSQVNRQYGGINSIPTTFVIDREGRARAKHVGYVAKEVFEQQIKALL